MMSSVDSVPAAPTDHARAAVLAALSDVVTVTDPDNTDAEPRPLPPAKSEPGAVAGFGSRMAGAFNKMRGHKKPPAKDGQGASGKNDPKGPSRIDVIDRLDASGLHGMSLFHHDSPYDACSPHSNRHGHKAPVKAFTFEDGPPGRAGGGGGGSAAAANAGGSRQNLSPLAQATLQRMNAADSEAGSASSRTGKPPVHRSRTMDSATTPFADDDQLEKPSLGRAQSSDSDFSTTAPPPLPYSKDGGSSRPSHNYSHSASSAVSGRNKGYITKPSEQSNPLAEAWGIVPEPWTDFATPAAPVRRSSSDRHARNGRGGGSRSGAGLSPYGEGDESGTPSAASSVLDMEAVLTGKTSSSNKDKSNLGYSDGTITRPGGRNARTTSGGVGFGTVGGGAGIIPDDHDDGSNAPLDNSGEFVIAAGVSPFPEPDYGGARNNRDRNEGAADGGAYGGAAAGSGPKRSKSLIKRMKSARREFGR
ncbi:unnamed protein product [Tilletia controversa]|nr:unnamed protein product [Tilletia controversa]